jgi:hypothetical protein
MACRILGFHFYPVSPNGMRVYPGNIILSNK